jgi:Uma2 family endonuclease
MGARQQLHWFTVDEFLMLEAGSSVRHEYVDGYLYAMAGASARHNDIVGNIYGNLWSAARGNRCKVYGSDMLVRVAHNLFYYPDVSVTCDPEDTNERYKFRPCVLVEVLSPSTSQTDRTEKLIAYRAVNSLRDYLIVSQDDFYVEHHWRDERGTWQQRFLSAQGTIAIQCLDTVLTVGQIYEGLEPVTSNAE